MNFRRLLYRIIVWLTAAVTLAGIIGFVYDSFFFNMKQLPEGNFVCNSTSADGRYTVALYKISNSLGEAVRGELTDNKTGTAKNVYWETDTSGDSLAWLNCELININGHVVDITSDIYDSRRPIIVAQDVFGGQKR